ncbi:TetR/AcrR family transcriptional regulator [Nocardia rhizosphaerae]|uniref:TetR/AcrR family transcriptional regulator n=1 Tax=Nocardia rhizosphaerae TaxID=1691571 RepID=A0ABV8L8X8_9NOCA
MVYVDAEVRRGQLVSAARAVLARNGVAKTTLRAVAAEAGVPLGTMQYVFPAKEQLLRAVIEDVVGEIARVLEESADLHRGLAHAIRQGLMSFWSQLVAGHAGEQLMQYELTTYALRTAGQESLARWQYERYTGIVADWCRHAADSAGETSAVPFDRLGRVIVACVDGLILQHASDPDTARSNGDLGTMIDMVIGITGVGPEQAS